MKRLLALTLVTAGLGGCSLIPKYDRPAMPVDGRYPYSARSDLIGSDVPVADLGWKDFFRSPASRELIASALENNRDLRVAGEQPAAPPTGTSPTWSTASG